MIKECVAKQKYKYLKVTPSTIEEAKNFIKAIDYIKFTNEGIEYEFDEFVGWLKYPYGSYIVQATNSKEFIVYSNKQFDMHFQKLC